MILDWQFGTDKGNNNPVALAHRYKEGAGTLENLHWKSIEVLTQEAPWTLHPTIGNTGYAADD